MNERDSKTNLLLYDLILQLQLLQLIQLQPLLEHRLVIILCLCSTTTTTDPSTLLLLLLPTPTISTTRTVPGPRTRQHLTQQIKVAHSTRRRRIRRVIHRTGLLLLSGVPRVGQEVRRGGEADRARMLVMLVMAVMRVRMGMGDGREVGGGEKRGKDVFFGVMHERVWRLLGVHG